MKNDILFYGFLSFTILIYYYFYIYEIKIIFIVSIINAIFSLIVVFITMKIRFDNEFLKLLNSHSYSIYLLQRAVMIYISKKKYFESNEFIRFFLNFQQLFLFLFFLIIPLVLLIKCLKKTFKKMIIIFVLKKKIIPTIYNNFTILSNLFMLKNNFNTNYQQKFLKLKKN